jgi:hypothetical protein
MYHEVPVAVGMGCVAKRDATGEHEEQLIKQGNKDI